MPHHTPLRRLVHHILLFTLLGPTVFQALPAHAASPLVIGEVAWAGSSLGSTDEWLEIWNLGTDDVPLGGYALQGAGESGKTMYFPSDAVIPAKSAYVISNYAADDAKSVLAATQLATSTVSLSNSALGIVLVDGAGTVIDRAGTGGLPPAGSNGAVKATMVRDGDAWITATSSAGFDPGHPDLGTPGICDGCISTPPTSTDPIIPPVDTATTTTDPLLVDPIATSTETIATSTEILITPTSTDVIATSTEPIIGLTPTSTDPATSTNPLPTDETPTSTATATETATTTAITTALLSSPIITSPVSPAITPRYDLLRLNAFMPNPSDGKEWIEITSIDRSIPVPLTGIRLYDASGSIFTFASGTVDTITPTVVATLSSARLNNDGDTVTLRDAGGTILDGVTYHESQKGVRWMRVPTATGSWQMDTPPTTTNTSSETVSDEPVLADAPVQDIPLSVLPVIDSPPTIIPTIVVTSATTTATSTAPKTKKSAPKKPTAKKPSTSASSSTMTSSSSSAIRVSLHGTVNSPPGLLTGHAFILSSPDGRGLLVRIPTSKKLPALGDMVGATGTLRFTDVGVPYLQLNASDGWMSLPDTHVDVPPRIVDLLAPSEEDAWSLVNVTGTVRVVRNTMVTLDLNDVQVDVSIKPAIQFRSSRLAVGDTIRVTALLDTSGADPRLIPRTNTDIELISHAPQKPTATGAMPIGSWTPFGAAGAAIVGTEGLKHLRERRKKRELEKILETDLNTDV